VREINHLSVHQRLRAAILDSQQPTSPIGFLFSKLPPQPCAVLLVNYRIYSVFALGTHRKNSTLEGKGAIEHKEELRVKDRNYRVFFGCHFFDLVDEDG